MIHHSGHLPPKRSETARIPFRASGPLCFRGSAATAKAQFRLIRGLPRDRVHETGVPQTMCVGGKSASENRTASQPSCASPKLYPHRKSGDSLARQLSRSSDGTDANTHGSDLRLSNIGEKETIYASIDTDTSRF